MEKIHLETSRIEDPTNIEDYTMPHAPYVILSVYPDCDTPDIRICRSVEDVIANAKDMSRNYRGEELNIEELYNYEDYDEDTVNYAIAVLKGLEAVDMGELVPQELMVCFENDEGCTYYTTGLEYEYNEITKEEFEEA